jgi:hypothetical protein
MLYKFKSKSTGDVIMLEVNGRRVLEIIGKDTQNGASQRGIVLAADMPAALAALEAAVAREALERQAALQKALATHQPPPRFDAIALRQRALPFMDLLRRCAKDGHDIVWGV